MGFFDKFPYTNFHELNLDWIISKIKTVETSRDTAVSSAAAAEQSASNASASEQQAADSQSAAAGSASAAAESAAGIEAAREQIYLNTQRLNNLIVDGQQTAGNTELLDIRVGYDGTIYDTAGNAVRGQVSDLNAALTLTNTELNNVNELLVNGRNGIKASALGTFVQAGLDNIDLNPSQPFRCSSEDILYTDRDLTCSVKNGFKFGWSSCTSEGVFITWNGWFTETVFIPKGTYFRIQIAKVVETSVPADINEFTSAITIDTLYDSNIRIISNILRALEGKDNLLNHGSFIHGSLDYSNYQFRTYRICSDSIISFPYGAVLNIADGYRIVIEYYVNGSWVQSVGWKTESYTVPAGSNCKFVIAKVTESQSTYCNLYEFIDAITFDTSTEQRLDLIESLLNTTSFVPTPWTQEIHRGITSENIPENTIPSYLEVAKNGFKQFECDVRKTLDGVLVMAHDATITGLVEGVSTTYTIANTNYSELLEMVLATDSEYGEIHIATLENALKVAYFNDLVIHIDIKDYTAISDVANMVINTGMSGRTIYNPNSSQTSDGLAIMAIDKRATVLFPYNKENIETYYPTAFEDKAKIIIAIPYYNITNEAIEVMRESGFKSLIYDVLNSTYFEYRPDIIEYRTASATVINTLNKTYMDSITY